ncbi:hypothetical protein AB0F77_39775 [Streptomyces sp. NPDC026672]|uniref:hypothetical protein n=1 Tax=Actinomycetes TaxID=1760 RepID=UPI0033CB607A
MKRETYKGRKIKVVAGKGRNWGTTRQFVNGVDLGPFQGDEDAALRSLRGDIDFADSVGPASGRCNPEWFAPGTYELCDEGHATEIGGECGHHYCAEKRSEAAPVVGEPTPIEHRVTTIRVAGVERVIRTELVGKVRTTKQLEAAHTKAVKAAVVEMRQANLPNLRRKVDQLSRSRWYPMRDEDVKDVNNSIRRAERGTFPSHGTPGVSVAPFSKVKFTDKVPAYLVEVEPGHYATEEAAKQLTVC